MKQPQDRVIYNLDGEAVIDLNTGEYLMDFDEYQKEQLDRALEHGWSIRGFAYKNLPGEFMNMLVLNFSDKNKKGPIPSDLDIWKLVHTDLDPDQFCHCAGALFDGLNMVDKIDNICMYSNSFLYIVSIVNKFHDVDITDKIHPELSLDELLAIEKDVAKEWGATHNNN